MSDLGSLPAHYRTRARILTAGQGRDAWLAVIIRPEPPFDELVDRYWFVQGRVPCGPVRLSPTPGIELTLNLGDPFCISDERGPVAARVLNSSWLEGMLNSWIDSAPTGATTLIGVRLNLTGAFRAIGPHILNRMDPVAETELVLGLEESCPRQRLGEQRDLGARFAVLEAYARSRLARSTEVDRRVAWAEAQITKGRHWSNIRALSEALGISHQRLVDIFREYVGTTPKRLARITRFNRLIRFLATAPAPDWPAIALDFGFHDQALLIREFRSLAGCCPTTFSRRRDGLSGTVMMCEMKGPASGPHGAAFNVRFMRDSLEA